MKSTLSVTLAVVFALICIFPATAQSATPEPETLILYVGPQLVECTGVAPQQCLQIKFAPDAEWQLHYENIRNFEHIPGVEYALLVTKVERDPTPADASSFFYQLVSVLQVTPVEQVFSDLYAPSGEFVIAEIAPETQTCRDGFTPEIDCLSVSISSEETALMNPARIQYFAFVPGSTYTLVLERLDLATDNISDVPAFIYQLVQIAEITPESA